MATSDFSLSPELSAHSRRSELFNSFDKWGVHIRAMTQPWSQVALGSCSSARAHVHCDQMRQPGADPSDRRPVVGSGADQLLGALRRGRCGLVVCAG